LENRKPEISFQPDAIYTAIEASGINLRTANENWFNLGPIDNDRPHPHSCANTHTLAGTQIHRYTDPSNCNCSCNIMWHWHSKVVTLSCSYDWDGLALVFPLVFGILWTPQRIGKGVTEMEDHKMH